MTFEQRDLRLQYQQQRQVQQHLQKLSRQSQESQSQVHFQPTFRDQTARYASHPFRGKSIAALSKYQRNDGGTMNHDRGLDSRKHSSSSPNSTKNKHSRQSSPPLLPTATTAASATTPVGVVGDSERARIDGKGLWRSWQRNFRTHFDAMLDLMDNCFDARSLRIRVMTAAAHGHPDQKNTTMLDRSILIINACPSPVQPMAEILTVFRSHKNQAKIGENGVGVKQASANLSNLSFCVTHDRTMHMLEIGILSVRLQQESCMVLPRYRLQTDLSLESQMDELLRIPDGDEGDDDATSPYFRMALEHWGEGLMESGGATAADMKRVARDAMYSGRDQLMTVITHILDGPTWASYNHVFALVLADLTVHQPPASFLDDLNGLMGKTYVHIRKEMDILIGGKAIACQHWERRLADLTVFDMKINREVPIAQDDTWLEPISEIDQIHRRCYMVRAYLGFDVKRNGDDLLPSCASLYVYSRACGRLVKYDQDARALLGLASGGSSYAQGLTILLDDYQNQLPLTPTKQDLAFADEATGEIHRRNLYSWLRGIVTLYYRNYAETIFMKKGLLNAAVQELQSRAKTLEENGQLQPLRNYEAFNRVIPPKWTYSCKTNTISGFRTKGIEMVNGPATQLQLRQPSLREAALVSSRSLAIKDTAEVTLKKRKRTPCAKLQVGRVPHHSNEALSRKAPSRMEEIPSCSSGAVVKYDNEGKSTVSSSRDDDEEDGRTPIVVEEEEAWLKESEKEAARAKEARRIREIAAFRSANMKMGKLYDKARAREDQLSKELKKAKELLKKQELELKERAQMICTLTRENLGLKAKMKE